MLGNGVHPGAEEDGGWVAGRDGFDVPLRGFVEGYFGSQFDECGERF